MAMKATAPGHENDDERWMRLAVREAVRAVGSVHPNPPVGCVVVRDGEVVGRGHTQPPPGPHAEVVALRAAGPAGRGGTLYATLEPCTHHGRTPPCTEAILAAGVSRVVVAVRDPHPAAAGGLDALRAAGMETLAGPCAASVENILAPFLHWARTGVPYVVLKSAMTLDGKTASVTGASRWISGPISRAYVHRLRRRLGAVMVGIGTVLADDPLLTVRRAHSTAPLPAPPTRIVLDSRLRLPITSRLVQSAREAPLVVACAEGADEQAMGALRALGADVLPLPAREGRPDPAILMQALGARGITGILAESGGELAFSLVETGCAQEALYFVAPRLLGGRDAPTPLGGPGYPSPDAGPRLERMTARRCGVDLVLRGMLAPRAPD
jgi:diaminohydroxyphosphoribosylaminopyrimidine deaminase/5-amino-6-(5-phosphoribosylamino)uracil reductase